MASMTSLFGILEFEKDPIEFGKFGTYLVSWLQDAGGFAAIGLLFWVVYVLATPQPNVVGSRRKLISRFMATTGIAALLVYGVAATLMFIGMARNPDSPASDAPPQAQAQVVKEETPLDRWQGYLIAIGGLFAILAFTEPFFVDMRSWRTGRIYAIAKLSFKEAIRRRIVWVFFLILVIFLFPASWFFKQKPEDSLKVVVNLFSYATTIILVFTGSLLAAFSIPTDVKNQTIHTIVTKPVERFEIAIGRFLGYITLVTIGLFGVTAVGLVLILTSNVQQAAKDESMKARSPLYGELTYTNRGIRDAGVDVGREYSYRKYIPGHPNSPYRAEWRFNDVRRLDTDGDAVPCEFAFDVYRTIKGRENEGVRCSFVFTTWKWDPKRKQEFDAATAAAFKDAYWRSDPYPKTQGVAIPRANWTATQTDTWEKVNKIAEEFGYFELTGFEVEDYHTKAILLPTGLIKNAAQGSPSGDNPQMQTSRGPARLMVSVKCESGGQFIGVAAYDFYLLESSGSFAVNFFKGVIGLWCRLCIVIALAISASTYLAGVISFLLALVIFLSGSVLDFIKSLANGTNVGGGPIESFTRLVRGETSASQLDPTPTIQVLLFADGGYRWLLRRVFNVIPDTDRFTWSNYVAQGFDIRFDFVLLNLIFLAAYLFPWFVLAYYLMRSREVAA